MLTTDQLHELTEAVHSRLKEFDMPDVMMPSRGVIRVIHEIVTTWQDEQLTSADLHQLAADWPSLEDVPDGVDVFAHLPVSGLPAPPDPDVARDKLAHALANGHAQLTHLARPPRKPARPGMYLPTFGELLTELKRQSMGGTMPTQAQFDLAKPTSWATSQSHCKRFGYTWQELAAAAELKVSERGRSQTVLK